MTATGKYNMTFLDFSGEVARFSVRTDVLDDINWISEASDRDALKAALTVGQSGEPFVLGELVKEEVIVSHEELSNAVPTDKFAQRELKWRVEYEDNVTFKRYWAEFPTADASLTVQGTDEANLADPAVAAFVVAWGNVVIAKDTGNATTIRKINLVGRNT